MSALGREDGQLPKDWEDLHPSFPLSCPPQVAPALAPLSQQANYEHEYFPSCPAADLLLS